MTSNDEANADEIITTTTESRRSSRRSYTSNVRIKQQSALDQIKQARAKGKIHRARVDDLIPDLYMDVADEDYQVEAQKNRNFVEDDDGAGYCDEDSEDEYDDNGPVNKNKKRNREKTKVGTIKHHFQVLNKKQKPQDEKNIHVDDDILKECLADIIGTSNFVEEDREFVPSVCDDVFTNFDFLSKQQSEQRKRDAPLIDDSSILRPLKLARSTIFAEHDCESSAPASKQQQELIELEHDTSLIDNSLISRSLKLAGSTNIVEDDCESSTSTNNTLQLQEQFLRNTSSIDNNSITQPLNLASSMSSSTNCLRFYFIDAFENKNIYKYSGNIYLFGRVFSHGQQTSESCCLIVKNVIRQLFFIKRNFALSSNKPVSFEDLRKDVQQTLKKKYGITITREPKLVVKRFISSDESVPKECEALEVLLEYNYDQIPVDATGDCFSHVMNTTTTPLERLLVEREIYGPCWLKIENPEPVLETNVKRSQCKVEYRVDMETISMGPITLGEQPPQISFVSINILTALDPKTRENQIVMVSLIHHYCNLEKYSNFDKKTLANKRYCVLSKLKNGLSLPFDFEDQLKKNGIGEGMVTTVANELGLLSVFLNKLGQLDPDIILGHDLTAQLAILHAKMLKHKHRLWYVLGRLKRQQEIQSIGAYKFAQWELTAGRLCLDTKIAASELLTNFRSYEIQDLIVNLLKDNSRIDLIIEEITQSFLSTKPKINLIELIKWNWIENWYTLKIVEQLNAIPLFVQITQIIGGVLSRTLLGGRAERNEYLLLHACFHNNYVPPDKRKNVLLNKKAQYTGGLVLEPKKGLYETYIILLDFNSLYPSIIREFNICFTTVDHAFAELSEDELPTPPGSSRPDGILKMEIGKLVNKRREVKSLMNKEKPGSDKYQQYYIRQLGLKLTANSMYGCLGFSNSRFFAKTLAAMITAKGRELLLHTKTLVESENFSVVYGDTDSIMVNSNTTDFQQAKLIGQKLKQIVNKNYSLLELDIDGIYKRLLLYKKKKYAALAVDINDEKNIDIVLKGLDIVRRDWSEIAKDIGEEIVNLILSSLDRDTLIERIRNTLIERRRDLEKVMLEKFEIFKQLTRDPTDYKDAKSLPHVIVALRLNESKKFQLHHGDIVKYVICKDGTNNAPIQRAYHVSEIISNEELHVDIDYYVSNQIYPVITRLCEPIDEINSGQIAELIGHPNKTLYRHRVVLENDNENDKNNAKIQFSIGTRQDFTACEGFSYECPYCKKLNIIRDVAVKKNNEFRFGLAQCTECSKDVRALIKRKLRMAMADHIKRNNKVLYVCDDIICGAEYYVVGRFQFTNEGIQCTKCQTGILRKQSSDKKLFDQQCFFKFITDFENFKAEEKFIGKLSWEWIMKYYKECHMIVLDYMNQNSFNKVDLSVVFAPLFKNLKLP